MLENLLNNWGYTVISVSNGNDAFEALIDKDGPCLALLDWIMPEMEGIEVCKALRKYKKEPYVYIIIISTKMQEKDIVSGIEAGADDYIVKPFFPPELEVRLKAGRRIIQLQEELMYARDQLKVRAMQDPLTQIYNQVEGF